MKALFLLAAFAAFSLPCAVQACPAGYGEAPDPSGFGSTHCVPLPSMPASRSMPANRVSPPTGPNADAVAPAFGALGNLLDGVSGGSSGNSECSAMWQRWHYLNKEMPAPVEYARFIGNEALSILGTVQEPALACSDGDTFFRITNESLALERGLVTQCGYTFTKGDQLVDRSNVETVIAEEAGRHFAAKARICELASAQVVSMVVPSPEPAPAPPQEPAEDAGESVFRNGMNFYKLHDCASAAPSFLSAALFFQIAADQSTAKKDFYIGWRNRALGCAGKAIPAVAPSTLAGFEALPPATPAPAVVAAVAEGPQRQDAIAEADGWLRRAKDVEAAGNQSCADWDLAITYYESAESGYRALGDAVSVARAADAKARVGQLRQYLHRYYPEGPGYNCNQRARSAAATGSQPVPAGTPATNAAAATPAANAAAIDPSLLSYLRSLPPEQRASILESIAEPTRTAIRSALDK